MVECKTLFYNARKTSLCERMLKKSFLGINLEPHDISFVTDKKALKKILTDSFKECNIVFIIGGLGFGDERNISDILSRLLKPSCVDECKKLKNDTGDDGYVVRANNQLLILLPDEPEQIQAIMKGAVLGYISNIENTRV